MKTLLTYVIFVGSFYFEKMLIHCSKYQIDVYIIKCTTSKSDWICKSCLKSVLKNKMSMQAYVNNLEISPKFIELDGLCPIELMSISQIISFMFIAIRTKDSQRWIEGQCVLVPRDLKKVWTILPRACNDKYLISLALKHWLTDKSAVNKQLIQTALFSKALEKLAE